MLSGFIEPKHPVPAHDQSAGASYFIPLFLFSLNLLKHKLLVSHQSVALLLHNLLSVPNLLSINSPPPPPQSSYHPHGLV